MTAPAEHSPASAGGGPSRRALLAKKRQSRRPSRLGVPAGATPKPDRVSEDDAGFAGLLKRAWQQATSAPDLRTAVDTLLTLGGHVPADIQLRALRTPDEAALKVLCGRSWRTGEQHDRPCEGTGEEPAFLGELGLTTGGRIVVRVPSQGPLASRERLVGGSMRVPWSGQDLLDYQSELERAEARLAEAAADCRAWLNSAGPEGRSRLLEQLKEAALRTAPFVLYQEDKQYTNFRDRNTVTGKTLWPGHPDCSLSSLQGMPLRLWSDNDAVMVVCLTLLVRSAGFGRIEEANGTQLSLDHIALLLERTRRNYNSAVDGQTVPPAPSARVEDLDALAAALGDKRRQVATSVQLYREIHGALMHKIERVAAPYGDEARRREEALCASLREQLPLTGCTLEELGAEVQDSPGWLARPYGGFGTGLESLVYEAVSASAHAFEADFAMSRGIRSLPLLIQALRAQDWAEITQWGITDFFCCVVPLPEARRYFAGSTAQLADTAWAMSSRMQYNSWHFIAGNLPKVPEVTARDHFVPPTIPDIAFYSDQHHHGHVANRVRFSVRSPQAVDILDRPFNGFMDLRLLRCEGTPFHEQDLLAAHRTSAFVARATSSAARLVAEGEGIEVTSFDSVWHGATIAGPEAAAP
ncbi:hypothetical protein FBY35_0623 [Streptomyces sp. SLBN-118]|uniref:hypothetical protein n=1 Tax=Streptomyces sp. SLBN-118 TaxID=2768454 RepID=UPI001150AABD|nr:hypothetical protein [Streptomyces sp. SLBN-118]TQK50297.1 hypothetical protein FBY35_0623 [Streptomyces sp. SLBN-118]